jgi:hypothetical protein
MNIKITFQPNIGVELQQLILNSIRNSKTSGYTLSLQLHKLRGIYHSNLPKDKVDSIATWIAKQGSVVRSIVVDGVAWTAPVAETAKPKTRKVKKVS